MGNRLLTQGQARRWVIVACVLAAFVGLGLVFGLQHVMWIRARTARRQAWLQQAETEVGRKLQSIRSTPAGPDPAKWLVKDHARFERGAAAWQVHTMHEDRPDGGDGADIGDIVIVIDDQGRAVYSRSHFCDGTLPWGLGIPDISKAPARPADFDAFLGLFRPGTWTRDRSVVEPALPPPEPPK